MANGAFDAVPDLARAFPLKAFPDAVGLAQGERENLFIYANMVFNALGPDNGLRRRSIVARIRLNQSQEELNSVRNVETQ